MPLTLNVGLSRKVGMANYGSRGGSVTIEVEVESALASEPGRLRERIRQLFALVRASLHEELAGCDANPSAEQAGSKVPQPEAPENGPAPRRTEPAPRPATESQVKAIYALTRKHQLDLSELLQERFQVDRPEELSLREASAIIGDLRSMAPENGRAS